MNYFRFYFSSLECMCKCALRCLLARVCCICSRAAAVLDSQIFARAQRYARRFMIFVVEKWLRILDARRVLAITICIYIHLPILAEYIRDKKRQLPWAILFNGNYLSIAQWVKKCTNDSTALLQCIFCSAEQKK